MQTIEKSSANQDEVFYPLSRRSSRWLRVLLIVVVLAGMTSLLINRPRAALVVTVFVVARWRVLRTLSTRFKPTGLSTGQVDIQGR